MSKKIIKPKDEKDKYSKTVNLNKILVNDLTEEEYTIEKGELSLDILEDEKYIYIESPVAGVKVSDLNIDIEPEKITINGFRKKTKEDLNRKYIHRECFYGNFSRSIILPVEINPEKTTAKIDSGILKITLLKLKQ